MQNTQIQGSMYTSVKKGPDDSLLRHQMVVKECLLYRSQEEDQQLGFVFQEWWGLNDNIKRHADEIYKKDLGNVNVLALDMYDGKMATDADNAGKLMQAFKQERGDMIVKGAVAYAGEGRQNRNRGILLRWWSVIAGLTPAGEASCGLCDVLWNAC